MLRTAVTSFDVLQNQAFHIQERGKGGRGREEGRKIPLQYMDVSNNGHQFQLCKNPSKATKQLKGLTCFPIATLLLNVHFYSPFQYTIMLLQHIYITFHGIMIY